VGYRRIEKLKPSQRGELEVTDLINSYILEGACEWTTLEGFWRDAGTFDTLYEVNKYWAEKKR